MALHLETDRLILRLFVESDAEAFSAYRSDPEIARFQGWEAPFSITQAQEFISKIMHLPQGEEGVWYQVAIQLRETGELIGDCGFSFLDDCPEQAEIGYSLARPYHGQGYATEAVIRLLDYLFDTWDLHRVRAACDVENTRSMLLMERIGMRREAHFVDHVWFKGRWVSEYWYAILQDEWCEYDVE